MLIIEMLIAIRHFYLSAKEQSINVQNEYEVRKPEGRRNA